MINAIKSHGLGFPKKNWLFQVLLIAFLYYITARLSLLLAFQQSNASPVWPASGLAFAAVLLLGNRIWPGIMAGAFLSNVTVFLTNQAADTGIILATSLLISVGNTFEAILGGILFHRFIDGRNPMDRVADVFKFFLVVMLMCLGGSLFGPTFVCMTGIVPWELHHTVWLTWWMGDMAGVITLAPIIMAGDKGSLIPWRRRTFWEFILFTIIAILVNLGIFGEIYGKVSANHALVYAPMLLIVWAAFRFGQVGVSLTIIIMLALAIGGTIKGFGPFMGEKLNDSLLLLQFFIGVVTLTGLSLAAALNERKAVEEALRKSEERFRGIYDSSKDAIGYVNLDGILLDINDAFVRLTGYSKEELLEKKSFQDLTPRSYHAFEAQKIEEIFRSGKPVEYEKEYIRKDGSRIPVLLTTFIVRGPDGNAAGMAAIVKDITEQKKIREEQTFLAAIVGSSSDAIIGKTLDGTITSWNHGAEQLYGYTAEEMIGKHISLLVPEENPEEISEILDRLKDGEKIERYETVRVDKSGKRIDVSLTISLIKDGHGKTIGASTIARDITERKRTEQQMQEAVKVKSEFTSTVSHELRTPLAITKEALSLLLREKVGKIQDKQKEILSMANSNLDRLGILINDILDFSKVEAGKMELHREWVDVASLLQQCCKEWRLQANSKKIELAVHVPNETEPINLYVDKIRLIQILSNLINNAIKFTPEHTKIEVSLEDREDLCQFSVKDNGPGISPSEIPKLFQKFQQLNRSYGPGLRGTGLGLSIMKSLVELHGGQVHVESTVGRGAKFSFTIPKITAHHHRERTFHDY